MENIIIAFLICATIYFLANPVSVPRREPLAQAADDQQDSTGVPSPRNSTTHHPRHGLDPGLRQSLLLGEAESAGDWAGAGEVQNGDVRPTRGSTRGFGPGTLGAAMVFGVRLRRLRYYRKEVRRALNNTHPDEQRAEFIRESGQTLRELGTMNGDVVKQTARIVKAVDAAFNPFDNVDSVQMLAFVQSDHGQSCFDNFLARNKVVEVDRFVRDYMARP